MVAAEQKAASSHAWALRGLWDGEEATEDSARKATWTVDKTQTFIMLASRENRKKSHEETMRLADQPVHDRPFIL